MGRWPEGGERPSRDPHYSLPTLQPICLVGLEFFDLVSNGGTIEVWQVSIAMNSTNIEDYVQGVLEPCKQNGKEK